MPPHQQGGQRLDVEPADVERRQRGDDDVVGGEVLVVDAVAPGREQRALGVDGALRRSCRAGGVDHERRIVERHRGWFDARSVLVGDGSGIEIDHLPDRTIRDVRARRQQELVEPVGCNQQTGTTVGQEHGDLRRSEPVVDRAEHAPDPEAGEKRLQELDSVQSAERDAIAAPDPGRRQTGCDRLHPLGEPAIADVLTFEHERDPIGVGPPGDQLVDRRAAAVATRVGDHGFSHERSLRRAAGWHRAPSAGQPAFRER